MKAFAQPLRIPQKSPSNASDDGKESGWSFGNVMHMMMVQSRMDNKRREHQYKIESKQREREYQLHWEELANVHEKAWEQRKLMNLLFMSMLNKNGGSNVKRLIIDALDFAHDVLVLKNLKGLVLISDNNPSQRYQMLSRHSTSPQFS